MLFFHPQSSTPLKKTLLIHNLGKKSTCVCEHALGVFLVTCHLRCCAALGDVLFKQEATCPVSSLPHPCNGNQLQGDLGCILLAKLYLSDDMCFDPKHCVID